MKRKITGILNPTLAKQFDPGWLEALKLKDNSKITLELTNTGITISSYESVLDSVRGIFAVSNPKPKAEKLRIAPATIPPAETTPNAPGEQTNA